MAILFAKPVGITTAMINHYSAIIQPLFEKNRKIEKIHHYSAMFIT